MSSLLNRSASYRTPHLRMFLAKLHYVGIRRHENWPRLCPATHVHIYIYIYIIHILCARTRARLCVCVWDDENNLIRNATYAACRGECIKQVTCNSRVNWRVHVYIFLGLNITSFRYEHRGEGSRTKRMRKRRQWVSVCRKPRIVFPLPPRRNNPALSHGSARWKRASNTTTTT